MFDVTLVEAVLRDRPHALAFVVLGVSDPAQAVTAESHDGLAGALQQLGFAGGGSDGLVAGAEHDQRAVELLELRARRTRGRGVQSVC